MILFNEVKRLAETSEAAFAHFYNIMSRKDSGGKDILYICSTAKMADKVFAEIAKDYLDGEIHKNKRYLKTTTTMTVITDLMLYGIIIYLLGIVLGFNRSYFVLDILTFSKNIIPVILITVLLEMLRYLVVSNCYKNIKVIFMFTVLSSILLVIYDANIGRITTAEDKFIFLSTIVFPIIAQEAICGYMSYKIACLPSFIYKLVLNIYIYIIPIVPNLGNYIYSVANIILPFLISPLITQPQ